MSASLQNLEPRQREPYRRHSFNRNTRRVGDLKRLFRHRHGFALPNDDVGRDNLFRLAYHLLKSSRDAKHALNTWAEVAAPWATAEDVGVAIEKGERFVNWENRENHGIGWSDAELGDRVALSYDERSALAITTIAPCDLTKAEFLDMQRRNKRARDVLRKEKNRRAAGVLARADYLKTTLTAKAPWQREGISRATWYKRNPPAARNVVRFNWAKRTRSRKAKVRAPRAPDYPGAS